MNFNNSTKHPPINFSFLSESRSNEKRYLLLFISIVFFLFTTTKAYTQVNFYKEFNTSGVHHTANIGDKIIDAQKK